MNYLQVNRSTQQLIHSHLEVVSQYIHSRSSTVDEAIEEIEKKMLQTVDKEIVMLIMQIVQKNKEKINLPKIKNKKKKKWNNSFDVRYYVSHIISEIILIGGLLYEAEMLGIVLDVVEAKRITRSELFIEDMCKDMLEEFARKYGYQQDFLFSGVIIPEKIDVYNIIAQTIQGKPQKLKRSLFGVGGLRYDTSYNYVHDIKTFVYTKILIDRRYYPGIWIFYLLSQLPLGEIPILKPTSQFYSEKLLFLQKEIQRIQKKEYKSVTILCSTELPDAISYWSFLHYGTQKYLELPLAFHSPSDIFGMMKKIFEDRAEISSMLPMIEKKLSYYWTFNSILHLPWTNKLSYLSHHLIGKIRNEQGMHCIRYGVGLKKRSIEIREYMVAKESHVQRLYQLRFYFKSQYYKGGYSSYFLQHHALLWRHIEDYGFFASFLPVLQCKNPRQKLLQLLSA